MNVGFIREEEAEQWARSRIGAKLAPGVFRAASIVNDAGEFICVAVLTNFSPRNVDINFAASPDAWARPKVFRQLFNLVFSYIFTTLDAVRATGLVNSNNSPCIRFIQKIGFAHEGTMRRAVHDADLMVFGLLRDEYRSHRLFGVTP